jgi:hypothetical protein
MKSKNVPIVEYFNITLFTELLIIGVLLQVRSDMLDEKE